MSAFVVNDRTINKIVTFFSLSTTEDWYRGQIKNIGYDFGKPLSIEKLAKDMFFLNCEAVDKRYGKNEAEKFRDLNFRYHEVDFDECDELEVIKSIRCWLYQCAEGEEIMQNPLYLVMEKLCGYLALNIVERTAEYKLAKWG